ncbi:hypothetical protein HHX47_DHR3000645 [Lentinula edodes]|nr:hypothetical protein HHX47_DHR3000645 [Lentinula edodes]
MSSDRSSKQRPQDVTLPPISQILDTIPSRPASSSDLSLPPLRVGHDQGFQEGSQQSGHRSSRAYVTSPFNNPSGVLDLQDPRMKRPRYDQSAPGGSSYPPVNRAASYSTPSPVASRYQPSGMTMPASSPVIRTERVENRYSGAPSLSYGPSPYSYVPPPQQHAQSSSYYAASSGSSRPPAMEDSRVEQRSPGYTPVAMAGQGSRPEEGPSKANKYECRYCGKGFLRPSALKIHIISHTGDKDFVCPEENCGRRFGVRSNMLRHIRLVHQNNHSHSSGEELSKDDEWSD